VSDGPKDPSGFSREELLLYSARDIEGNHWWSAWHAASGNAWALDLGKIDPYIPIPEPALDHPDWKYRGNIKGG